MANQGYDRVVADRKRLLEQLFPAGISRLWCPALTHYDTNGQIDYTRAKAHLAYMRQWVKGFLIPGSTGDGWELSRAETDELTTFAIGQAKELRFHLLIGVLKKRATEVSGAMLALAGRSANSTATEAAAVTPSPCSLPSQVSGFTICPPAGREFDREKMHRDLSGILQLGLPVALYQLPQLTQNEMEPGLVEELAAQFSNLILFKDSSGSDRVALSHPEVPGVFLVRGAEGGFARWFLATGGPYHGFLLSTANCFARDLSEMIEKLNEGSLGEGQVISDRLSMVIKEVFDLVKGVTVGNAFANANKAMDHFFAFGPRAALVPPPRLHAGQSLPKEVVQNVGKALERCGLMPRKGYLE